MTAEYGHTSFNEDRDVLYADLGLQNTGQYLVAGQLVVAVSNLSDPSVRVVDADGFTPDGLPYYSFTHLVDDGTLSPEEVTQTRAIAFSNPSGNQFTYELIVLGQLTQNLVFTTDPDTEALVGRAYSYDADIVAPNGALVTYELLTGPQD